MRILTLVEAESILLARKLCSVIHNIKKERAKNINYEKEKVV